MAEPWKLGNSFYLHFLAKGVVSPISPCLGNICPLSYHVVNLRLSHCNLFVYVYLKPERHIPYQVLLPLLARHTAKLVFTLALSAENRPVLKWFMNSGDVYIRPTHQKD